MAGCGRSGDARKFGDLAGAQGATLKAERVQHAAFCLGQDCPDVVDLQAGMAAYDIARALGAAGVDYALTGDAGANLYRSSAGETWPVLYVEDVDRAQAAAGLTRKEPGSFGMRVTLIPFDGVSELGRPEIDAVAVVARDQVIIDTYGGIDRMAEQADILVGCGSP